MERTLESKPKMEEYLPAILTFVTGLLAAFGGGIKWMLSRMDRHDERERAWQTEERAKLEKSFTEQIAALDQRVRSQNDEIDRLREELATYIRHVGILEGLLRANGIEVPDLLRSKL